MPNAMVFYVGLGSSVLCSNDKLLPCIISKCMVVLFSISFTLTITTVTNQTSHKRSTVSLQQSIRKMEKVQVCSLPPSFPLSLPLSPLSLLLLTLVTIHPPGIIILGHQNALGLVYMRSHMLYFSTSHLSKLKYTLIIIFCCFFMTFHQLNPLTSFLREVFLGDSSCVLLPTSGLKTKHH